MKNLKNYLKNNFLSIRLLPKAIAVLGGILAGFAIANWIGAIIGAIIGFFFEQLLAKAIKKNCFSC